MRFSIRQYGCMIPRSSLITFNAQRRVLICIFRLFILPPVAIPCLFEPEFLSVLEAVGPVTLLPDTVLELPSFATFLFPDAVVFIPFLPPTEAAHPASVDFPVLPAVEVKGEPVRPTFFAFVAWIKLPHQAFPNLRSHRAGAFFQLSRGR